ncbi:SGNH/GDSL hydrolase family protein [Aeromicrobium alkaliterrae]|uniref:SGNH hydrolase-type esterase domain-containing protein n=1 Tax=Aeromicrobium alkaliterrae TaxID=302168 RepID=A0ABP4W7T9_9ACTN
MSLPPLPVPLRVLVKGASTVTWTSTRTPKRTDLIYARVVEEQLLAAGQATEVTIDALSADRTAPILRTWEREVSNLTPDVIVLHYGHMECIHAVIPRWVERHARNMHDRPGPVRERYRRWFVRPVWKILVNGQQQIDHLLPLSAFRHRPRRVTALLERYVRHVSRFRRPLVVVMGLTAPADVWKPWFPGLEGRLDAMNGALRELVARLDDPDVRFVEVWDDAEQWRARGEEPCSDGGHYTPEFHRHVGTKVTAVVQDWLVRAESPVRV